MEDEFDMVINGELFGNIFIKEHILFLNKRYIGEDFLWEK